MSYLIIGAGPAGLAAAVALQENNIPFEIVDAGEKFGGIWDINRPETPMYKSAHFISSKTLSGFKGFPMPDHYPDYPSYKLIQDYIESYSEKYDLGSKTRFRTKVLKAERNSSSWTVTFDTGNATSYTGIICATGINWHVNLPEIEGDFDGEIIHSFEYKEDDIFRGKRVLIIGGGNSGCDIACDAAQTADQAFISMRRGYYFIPKYTLGMPSDLFKEKFGFPIQYIDTRVSEFLLNKVFVGNLENYGLQKPDHHLMESHPIMNSQLLHYLGHGDITVKKNVTRTEGRKVIFQDGTIEEIDLIVAATGYKREFPFLDHKLLDKEEGKEITPYLQVFSKKFDNLFFVGGIEFSAAAFGLFNLQADTIVAYLIAKQNKNHSYQQFLKDKQGKNVKMRGVNQYIDSFRHQRYVDKKQYKTILKKQIRTFNS